LSVEVIFEAVEVSRPKVAVGGEPVVELGKGFGPDAVKPTLRIRSRIHEPGVPEHAQVLGHTRLAQAQTSDKIADWSFAVAEQLEDGPPLRLCKHLERRDFAHSTKYAMAVI
jgi:hypothetical protein